MGEMCQLNDHGNLTTAVEIGVSPQMRGMRRLSTTRNWESPMVATVRISRGERRNRRTTTNSAQNVRTTTATSPVNKPTK